MSHTRPDPDAPVDTYETANKHHFDANAHKYDDFPGAREAAQKVVRAMRNTGVFKEGITTVMDFACGTGLISRGLAAENPKSIVGVDISQAMVDQYNQIVSNRGTSPEEVHAVCVAPHDMSALDSMTFDVIVCAAAYHHFTSVDEVTRTLVTYLNPGGSLLVADLIHGESTHQMFGEEAHHIVAHKGGFTEELIRPTFENAGLNNIAFEIIGQASLGDGGHSADLFLARGDK